MVLGRSDNRGYIVTNNHVIEGAKQIQVELYDGMLLPAQLTGVDPPDDLAVIKITPPPHMAVATIGDSSQLKVAEYVMAIGNPLGITQTVTSGIVSALGRNVPAGPGVDIIKAIQTDATINPGNSGGALVDLKGELIGVPTLTIINPTFNAPASGVGFAIPSVRRTHDQYCQFCPHHPDLCAVRSFPALLVRGTHGDSAFLETAGRAGCHL